MDVKAKVAESMRRVADLLAEELFLDYSRVQVEQPLNMPPYSFRELSRRPEYFDDGPTLMLGVVSSPTLWQVDLTSRDDSAGRMAPDVFAALRVIAGRLDRLTGRDVRDFFLSLVGRSDWPSSRLRIDRIDQPVDLSRLGRPCFTYTLGVQLPAIAGELGDGD